MPSLTAQSVLEMRFISYATPLELARRWLQSDKKSEQDQARELLEGLFDDFPHSLEIGQQLALAHIEKGEEDQAKTVLKKLSRLCRNPNEEVLSRMGRIYRDQGDRYVEYPEIGGEETSPPEALRYYRLALEQYTNAYRIRFGHYPGINVATLHLMMAALIDEESQRDRHLQTSRNTAKKLLAERENWPLEMVDDPIWHSATAGEANLLLHHWAAAAGCYHAARQHSEFRPFHRVSMRKQALRIVFCHQQLDVASLGAFDNLENVFPPVEAVEGAAIDS